MISENLNKEKNVFESHDLLRWLMAAIFLAAGIFRIFHPETASLELKNLRLPLFLSYFLIVFEIGAGFLLLFNRYLKIIYSLLIVFLLLALIQGLIVNGSEIISQAQELFVFRTNPTDFFLHIVFLVILISLVMRQDK